MKTKLITALATMAMLLLCAAPALAANVTPVDIRFTKHGGGQFLYCNNPEFISEKDLSTDENPNPVYMMKQEGLKPGKYSVFFCFYNWTPFDVEPDIEFVSDNAKITVNSVGYYIPKGWDYWDCLGAWSDYWGLNIRTIDGLTQYVPYQNQDLPKTFTLKKSNEWIHNYIYNYNSVSPKVTFNMLVDFTIESGTADVNFAALKSYDVLGDRSHHSAKATQSPYKNDTAIKGIERESLPIVETNLNVEVTSKMHDGTAIPVRVYNQYFPAGNTYDYWMTNINPNRDAYAYSKECSTESDMLSFELKDKSKLSYYGSGVAYSNRDDVWHFDIYHHNTTAYENGCPSKNATSHVPNDKLPEKLDIQNPPNLDYEFNLGNFGVTTRYHLNLKNSDTRKRSVNYYIDASFSSCIVAVRDKKGNLLNPYTLSQTHAFAQSKGINWQKKTDYMFSTMLEPGETKALILDVTLPTNCYGGIVNGLTADSKLLCEPKDIIEFPEKTEVYPYDTETWFDGYQTMRWQDGELYIYKDQWSKVSLPEETKKLFAGRTKDIRLTKTSSGYIARFAGYDQYGGNIADDTNENKLYILDNKFAYVKTIPMPSYVWESLYADGITYVRTDKIYESANGITFTESTRSEMPITDGKSILEKREDGWYIRYNGKKEFEKINFAYPEVTEIRAADHTYYMIRSLKNYDTDPDTGNFLAVSTDGVNYRDFWMPNYQLRFMRLDAVGDRLYAVGRTDVTERNRADYESGVILKTPKGYLSLNGTLEKFDADTCLDLNYLAEVFDITVTRENTPEGEMRATAEYNGNTVTLITGTNVLYHGDKSRFVGTAPYKDGNSIYVPFGEFMEVLGFDVTYDEKTSTVNVTEKTE